MSSNKVPLRTRFPHNPYGVLENAIRKAIADSRGRPLATVPPTLGQAIRQRVDMAFTTRRFTFTQLMKAVLVIPELVWFRPEAGIERELLSPETLATLDTIEPAALTGFHAAAIAVESLLGSSEWQLMGITPHLLFEKTAH
jgi:hypothetical protein